MKKLLPLLFLFASCDGKNVSTFSSSSKTDDDIKDLKNSIRAREMTDSVLKNAFTDTTGVWLAPIKVIKAGFVAKEYSNFKDVSITFKNVSNKRIDAIKFSWYGVDAFGEPADAGSGSIVEGMGGGFTDTPIEPGKQRTSQWSILSSRGKKITKAWPTEVVFADGTKWKLK